MLTFNLKTDISKFRNSSYFQTIEHDTDNEIDHQYDGSVDTFGYIFSPQSIDFDRILEYWNLATHFDLKINSLIEEIENHIDQSLERNPKSFDQILQIHQRTYEKFDINPLFKNTTNLQEIYDYYHSDNNLKHLLFVYHDIIVSVLPISVMFEVFSILQNKTLHKIKESKHPCCQNKEEYLTKFDQLTHGLIKNDFDWLNVVCAGGMVLESMSINELNKFTDIDLFLFGSQEEQIVKAKNLCEYFQNKANDLSSVAWFGQINDVTTVCFESIPRTVQIILTKWTNADQIITDFDIYCNSVLYDGQNIMGTKKWINSITTSVTQHNPLHFVKNKRIYKTIKKGFTFDKKYQETPIYIKYVESGDALKDYGSHYYPLTNVDQDKNIKKMCECYHAETFTKNIKLLDFKSQHDHDDDGYFGSVCEKIEADKIILENNPVNNMLKICVQANDEKQNITFFTNYYQCQLVHKKGCTGCFKILDDVGNPTMFHDFFNSKSIIEVGDEFNESYANVCRLVEHHLISQINKKLNHSLKKKTIKISDNAIIILNDKKTTIDKIHEIYRDGFNDPLDAPFVRIKCVINHYCNGFISVSCVYAQFVYDSIM